MIDVAPSLLHVPQRWPASRLLWTLCAAIGLFAVTIAVANAFVSADRQITRDAFGQDFMAFYSAGRLAADGHGAAMYDLQTLSQTQRSIAEQAGYARIAEVAPWWNPPHVALLFAPLALLFDFRAALVVWTLGSLACLAIAGGFLARIVGEASPLRRHRGLVLAAIAVAPPTLQALGHGQNTPLSLLLLTLVVCAWRARNPIAAGIACAMLAYKPQLAIVVGAGLLATLGWRVIVGAMIGTIPPLLATLTLLPGAIDAFLDRVPANLSRFRFEQPYLWHRHATINAWLRNVLQGNAPGATHAWITALTLLATLAVAGMLFATWRSLRPLLARSDDVGTIALDRFIVACVLATPLLSPFYFDYDLLLLIVPAALIGREALTRPIGRALPIVGAVAFVWTMINPPLAEATGFNATVPLLCLAFALHVRRCVRREAIATPLAPILERADVAIDERPTRVAA